MKVAIKYETLIFADSIFRGASRDGSFSQVEFESMGEESSREKMDCNLEYKVGAPAFDGVNNDTSKGADNLVDTRDGTGATGVIKKRILCRVSHHPGKIQLLRLKYGL